MTLSDLLRDEIARHGPIPFRYFMERALYDPEQGYYASGRARIGRGGDFFTNVSVGPLFGAMLASQFDEMWERLGLPLPFTIVLLFSGGALTVASFLRAPNRPRSTT